MSLGIVEFPFEHTEPPQRVMAASEPGRAAQDVCGQSPRLRIVARRPERYRRAPPSDRTGSRSDLFCPGERCFSARECDISRERGTKREGDARGRNDAPRLAQTRIRTKRALRGFERVDVIVRRLPGEEKLGRHESAQRLGAGWIAWNLDACLEHALYLAGERFDHHDAEAEEMPDREVQVVGHDLHRLSAEIAAPNDR